jgi:hypothetical protein
MRAQTYTSSNGNALSRRVFSFFLCGILVLTCTQDVQAKTSKQKRLHNLERYNRPQEVGRSIFEFKLGLFSSTSENNRHGRHFFGGEGINSSVSFDARVSPNWYVGTAFDVGRGIGRTALFEMSVLIKAKLSENVNSGMRIGYGPGLAFVRDGYGGKTAFLSNKFVIEGLHQTRARFGWVGDVGVSFFRDIHENIDASITQIFIRFGGAFL